jgi:hypothetical protein
MSGSTAKAERRDLRRAVGVEAVSAIDAHTQAIEFLLPRVNSLIKAGQDHESRITYEHAAIVSLKKQTEDLRAIRHSTFWRRMRWLMTGH